MTENGKKIIAQLAKDKKVQKAINDIKNIKECVKILNDNGYKCVEEDFVIVPETLNSQKVSLDEAKAIVGGNGGCGCVGAGGGGGGTLSCGCVLCGCGWADDGDDMADCVCVGGGGGGTSHD